MTQPCHAYIEELLAARPQLSILDACPVPQCNMPVAFHARKPSLELSISPITDAAVPSPTHRIVSMTAISPSSSSATAACAFASFAISAPHQLPRDMRHYIIQFIDMLEYVSFFYVSTVYRAMIEDYWRSGSSYRTQGSLYGSPEQYRQLWIHMAKVKSHCQIAILEVDPGWCAFDDLITDNAHSLRELYLHSRYPSNQILSKLAAQCRHLRVFDSQYSPIDQNKLTEWFSDTLTHFALHDKFSNLTTYSGDDDGDNSNSNSNGNEQRREICVPITSIDKLTNLASLTIGYIFTNEPGRLRNLTSLECHLRHDSDLHMLGELIRIAKLNLSFRVGVAPNFIIASSPALLSWGSFPLLITALNKMPDLVSLTLDDRLGLDNLSGYSDALSQFTGLTHLSFRIAFLDRRSLLVHQTIFRNLVCLRELSFRSESRSFEGLSWCKDVTWFLPAVQRLTMLELACRVHAPRVIDFTLDKCCPIEALLGSTFPKLEKLYVDFAVRASSLTYDDNDDPADIVADAVDDSVHTTTTTTTIIMPGKNLRHCELEWLPTPELLMGCECLTYVDVDVIGACPEMLLNLLGSLPNLEICRFDGIDITHTSPYVLVSEKNNNKNDNKGEEQHKKVKKEEKHKKKEEEENENENERGKKKKTSAVPCTGLATTIVKCPRLCELFVGKHCDGKFEVVFRCLRAPLLQKLDVQLDVNWSIITEPVAIDTILGVQSLSIRHGAPWLPARGDDRMAATSIHLTAHANATLVFPETFARVLKSATSLCDLRVCAPDEAELWKELRWVSTNLTSLRWENNDKTVSYGSRHKKGINNESVCYTFYKLLQRCPRLIKIDISSGSKFSFNGYDDATKARLKRKHLIIKKL